jgi:hypothetical protein
MKQWIFRLLGKGPEAVVVTFCSGDAELRRRMAEEVRSLVPDRRHFVATVENWPKLRHELKPYRHRPGTGDADRRSQRAGARHRLAPHKILAYNSRLERHHLRFDLASRFCSGAGCRWTASISPTVVAVEEARAFRSPVRLSRSGGARLHARPPPCGRARRTFPIRWRMAVLASSTPVFARWRSGSMSNCSLSPMRAWNWRRY